MESVVSICHSVRQSATIIEKSPKWMNLQLLPVSCSVNFVHQCMRICTLMHVLYLMYPQQFLIIVSPHTQQTTKCSSENITLSETVTGIPVYYNYRHLHFCVLFQESMPG